jgi:hypothetical protein
MIETVHGETQKQNYDKLIIHHNKTFTQTM